MIKDVLDGLEVAEEKKNALFSDLLGMFAKHKIDTDVFVHNKHFSVDRIIEIVEKNDLLAKLFEYKKQSDLVKAYLKEVSPRVIELAPEYYRQVFCLTLQHGYEKEMSVSGYDVNRKSVRVRTPKFMTKFIPREYLEHPVSFDFKEDRHRQIQAHYTNYINDDGLNVNRYNLTTDLPPHFNSDNLNSRIPYPLNTQRIEYNYDTDSTIDIQMINESMLNARYP